MIADCICIVSGGLDSTVMLYEVLRMGYEPIVLTFHYGQKHKLEIEYAQRTCDNLGLEHHVLTIPTLQGSALTDNDKEIPKEDYSVESQKVTVVPNRNMIFLSIAVNYTIAHKCELVFYAAHKSDALYPDCSKGFVSAMNIALLYGNYEKVRIIAPFIGKSKAKIVALGDELGVPFEETWSCYDPQAAFITLANSQDGYVPVDLADPRDIHCGVCGTCRERKEAFKVACVEDPTEYKQ